MKDFHTHPNLLKKPAQAEAFITKAIQLGFQEIYFTDHMPFRVTGDESDRIPFGGVSAYCLAVSAVAEKYAGQISVRTGIEIDYWPKCRNEIEEILAEGDFDYILGSSHLDIKGFQIPFGSLTRTDYARRVLENYISAAESGYFHALSHLDIYRWPFCEPERFPFQSGDFRWECCVDLYRELFRQMQAKKLKLELNAAPLYKKFDSLGIYPQDGILELSREYGLSYVYGSDAHKPEYVGYGYETVKQKVLWTVLP